ncbi:EAL domain-containing protein, partial [Novosphingobium sp. ST904]|uniref:sensor domain-containing protein n=1 Tax=Novosphingobium sp. ST904 TaxID=1684385 RepID=UPI00104399AA
RLLTSGDSYHTGIGLAFSIAAGVILRSLAKGHAAFQDSLRSGAEMATLIEALQSSQEHYRHSVELNPQIPWITNETGAVVEVSPRWTILTGTSTQEALNWGWTAAVHPDDLLHVLEAWKGALAAAGINRQVDVRYRLKSVVGGFRWFRARALPRLGAQDNVLAWYGNLEDIDDQVIAEQALQSSEERYRLASLATNDVIWDVSLTRDTIEWSGAAATVLGYPETQTETSRNWWIERIHPDDRGQVLAHFEQIRDPGIVQWTQEFRFRAADGSYLYLVARSHVVRDAGGQPTRLIGSLQDVTSQRQYEDKLRWAAHYDSLTDLPNRALFSERLDAALRNARADDTRVQLVVLDVDRFKSTNDNLGHDAGDTLLQEIAARLVASAPASATVARLGGDEFAVILPGPGDHAVEIGAIKALLAEASKPVIFQGRQLDVSLSAGSAVAFRDGQNPEDLHKSADLALYAAKKEGPGRIRCFQSDLRASAERETQMLYDAREALLNDRIVPFYQPKVCLRTGECVGFEALLRWHHATGLRSPAAIGAALSDPDISTKLTDRMMEGVIADLLYWRDSGTEVGRIAVNGSAADFQRGDFADRILGRLHRAGLPPSVLELEVTETVFVGQLADTVSTALETLSEAGVTIALDDFGTGYASLTHLQQFPVDTLKIDRSFISRLDETEREDATIVRAVIDLARNLDIKTVGEGIETPTQAAYLTRMQCDIGQGFLFGRPMPAGQIANMISNWNITGVLGAIQSDAEPSNRSA